MATSIIRQSLGFDEAFNIPVVSEDAPKNGRTPNLYDMTDPGWTKPGERFELGNYYSLYPANDLPLSRLLSMMERQQELLMSILNKVIELLTTKKDA